MENTMLNPDPTVTAALDTLEPASTPDVERALRQQLAMQSRAAAQPAPFWQAAAAKLVVLRRPALLPVAAVMVLALALFTSPVQGLAAQFLTIFRVQDVQPITVDTSSALPDLSKFGDMSTNGGTRGALAGSAQVGTLADAASKVGFTPQIPSQVPSGLAAQPGAIAVTPGETVGFTFRAAKAKAYLASINRSDVSMPAKFDGASLQLNVPSAVIIAYLPPGTNVAALKSAAEQAASTDKPKDLKSAAQASTAGLSGDAVNALLNGNSFALVEAKSPTLDASGGVSADDLRNFLLSLPGIPDATKSQLQSIGDWRNTLPIPATPGSDLHKVSINGAPGVAGKNGGMSMVVWVSNGIVHAISGPKLDEQALLGIAGSVK